jgi:hypothetical protein
MERTVTGPNAATDRETTAHKRDASVCAPFIIGWSDEYSKSSILLTREGIPALVQIKQYITRLPTYPPTYHPPTYLPTHLLLTYLPTHPPAYTHTHTHTPTTNQPTYTPTHLLPTNLPTYLPTHPPTHLLPTYLYTHTHTHTYTHLPTYLSIYLRTYLPIYLSIYLSMGLQPLWTLVAFQFLNLYTVGRTPWKGDQPFARPLPTHRATHTQNKRTQTSMPRVGFEPMIPMLEQAKTVHALHRAATVIGIGSADMASAGLIQYITPSNLLTFIIL